MYKVYGVMASRTARVLWMLEELGEAYDLIQANPQSDVARSVNPAGKVPVLVDGEDVLTDSTAILTYLADKHGKLTYPAGTVERAQQDALTHTVLDEFDAILWTSSRHSFVLPKEQRVPEVKPSLKWEFTRNLNRLSKRMVGPYLQGDQMTVADIIATHCLNWAHNAKFPVENEAMLAYAQSMRERPAFQRMQSAAT